MDTATHLRVRMRGHTACVQVHAPLQYVAKDRQAALVTSMQSTDLRACHGHAQQGPVTWSPHSLESPVPRGRHPAHVARTNSNTLLGERRWLRAYLDEARIHDREEEDEENGAREVNPRCLGAFDPLA